MIQVRRLQLDSRYNYIKSNQVYLNPANIETVETDLSDESVIHISMVSGEVIVAERAALNRILEKYY